MARLIDLRPNAEALPANLTVEVGDILVFGATGGHVRFGADAVELEGAFLTSVVAHDGQVLTPMGAPNTVLFRARRPGLATIDVITGDPWHASQSTLLDLAVEPSSKAIRDTGCPNGG